MAFWASAKFWHWQQVPKFNYVLCKTVPALFALSPIRWINDTPLILVSNWLFPIHLCLFTSSLSTCDITHYFRPLDDFLIKHLASLKGNNVFRSSLHSHHSLFPRSSLVLSSVLFLGPLYTCHDGEDETRTTHGIQDTGNMMAQQYFLFCSLYLSYLCPMLNLLIWRDILIELSTSTENLNLLLNDNNQQRPNRRVIRISACQINFSTLNFICYFIILSLSISWYTPAAFCC